MNQKEILTLINSRHEEFFKHFDLWRKMHLTYLGGENFKKNFLWRYEREDDEDWLNRLERCAYDNLFLDIIKRREAILYSRPVKRSASDILSAVESNFDGAASRRQQVIGRCFRLMQVFGFLPVLIDKSSDTAVNKLEQKQKKLFPYIQPIIPFNFLNWSLDERNEFEWVLIRSFRTLRSNPFSKSERFVEYRLWDRQKVTTWRDNSPKNNGEKYQLVASDEHGLGQVPVIILNDLEADDQSLVGRSSLEDTADLVIKLFNQTSWYDQLLYKTNYSTLAASPFHANSENPEIFMGVGDVLWVPEEGKMPAWISPDVGPAEIFEKRLLELRRRIYEQAELQIGIAEDTPFAISGRAYAYRSKPTEDLARRLALIMEEFENKLDRMICETWEGTEAPAGGNKYPVRYGVRALDEGIAELKAIESSSYLPPEIIRIVAARILSTETFASFSEEEMALMEELIFSFREGGAGKDAE